MSAIKLLILSNILLLVSSLTLISHRIPSHNHMPSVVTAPVIVGGFSPINVNNLTDDQKAIDQFIRNQQPKVRSGKLISGATQIVAGQNYRYVYNVSTTSGWQNWTIVVYEDLKGVDTISSQDVQDVVVSNVPSNPITSKSQTKVTSAGPTPSAGQQQPTQTPAPPFQIIYGAKVGFTQQQILNAKTNRKSFPNSIQPLSA